MLVLSGVLVIVAGGVGLLAGRVPWLGRVGWLPGDLVPRQGSATVFLPLIPSIILTVDSTIALNLVLRR